MSRSAPQLNIRSARARERARALSRRTGLTTTQVVEQALDAFEPSAAAAPDADETLPPGLIRKGWLWCLQGKAVARSRLRRRRPPSTMRARTATG